MLNQSQTHLSFLREYNNSIKQILTIKKNQKLSNLFNLIWKLSEKKKNSLILSNNKKLIFTYVAIGLNSNVKKQIKGILINLYGFKLNLDLLENLIEDILKIVSKELNQIKDNNLNSSINLIHNMMLCYPKNSKLLNFIHFFPKYFPEFV